MKKTQKILSAVIAICMFSTFTIFASAPVNADPNVGIQTKRSVSSGTSFSVTVPILPPVKHMASLKASKQLTGTYLNLKTGGRYKTVSVAQAYPSVSSSYLSPFVDISKGTNNNWLGLYSGTHVPSGNTFDLLGYSTGILSDTASGYWYYN
jgi:hypothetical protein